MSIPTQLLMEFLQEPLTTERVKIEAFLTVALGTRVCSQIIIPIDLPDGERLAMETEKSCRDAYHEATAEIDPKRKMELIRAFTEGRRKAFARIVLNSPRYFALSRWARKLGLRIVAKERLPTTWEVYFPKGWQTEWRLNHLMEMRMRILRGRKEPLSGEPGVVVFIEEFVPEYALELGKLLGYPSCCVERFIQDRVNSVSVEERAADQIRQLRADGRNTNPYAYYLKDFFPCSPGCPSAREQGEKIRQVLTESLPAVGEMYEKLLTNNTDLVEHYPEIIRRHKGRLRESLGA